MSIALKLYVNSLGPYNFSERYFYWRWLDQNFFENYKFTRKHAKQFWSTHLEWKYLSEKFQGERASPRELTFNLRAIDIKWLKISKSFLLRENFHSTFCVIGNDKVIYQVFFYTVFSWFFFYNSVPLSIKYQNLVSYLTAVSLLKATGYSPLPHGHAVCSQPADNTACPNSIPVQGLRKKKFSL